MHQDAIDLVRKCDKCQRNANISRRPSQPLTSITAPWPFAQWGMDFVGPLPMDNAMTNQLAGRVSTLRALPEEVLMNSFRISRDEARRVKFNREEATVFSPSSRSHQERPL
ncbi:hypothetical protein CFOL_v3_31929 [Cephalotus follicularis]|uniref:Integrase zinc-binding domain-containing protein n=1 Tax=Cephalotus follicularis TaxID=3775 RepID=A0A1Q3D7N2_CEPFO|nr:hypothetical protein CFOL_v3_31929 [Cephalotus follicularis]